MKHTYWEKPDTKLHWRIPEGLPRFLMCVSLSRFDALRNLSSELSGRRR